MAKTNKAYISFGKGQIGWGPLETMAHVQAAPVTGRETFEVSTPEELQQVVIDHGAKIVHFYATYMPRKAVSVEQCKEKKLFARWFNYRPRAIKVEQGHTDIDFELPEILL